jgi:hypothetical protein
MGSYAIIIGINHYTPPENDGLKTLLGAINDSQTIFDWVTGPGGVPAANCRLIQSSPNPLNPVKTQIDRAVTDIVRMVIANDNKDADRLYFYFAGHGLGVQGDRENNGLCMADWDDYMGDAATLSSSEYKRKFINEGLFKEIVIWLDCCRTTKLFLRPMAGPGIVPMGPNDNPRIMVAFATEYKNEAFEASNPGLNTADTRGIFTRVLIEGLQHGIPLRNGSVDGVDLINYLSFHVPIEAQNANFNQEPDIYSNINAVRTITFNR